MQKLHLIFSFLLCATNIFAQKAVQHAAYVGLDLPYLTMNYDARFRNPDHKVDFAVGGGLAQGYSATGLTAHTSLLFGKGAHSFEMGMNSFYNNYSYTIEPYYNRGNIYTFRVNQSNIEFRPFIGYRLQPKNKHFILQIQHSPYIFGTQTTKYLDFNDTYIRQTSASPYGGKNYYGYEGVSWLPHFALHLGCNINTIKKDDAENTAYEAPEKQKIGLEHTAAALFVQGFEYGNLGLAYDLRLRKPTGVDFALNIAYGLGYYNSFTQQYQASALFFKGKANLEVGLGVHSFYSFYPFQNPTKSAATAIGLPLGFRYQAHRHVFIRSYIMPYKAFYEDGNIREYPPKWFGFIDGNIWALSVGYTF